MSDPRLRAWIDRARAEDAPPPPLIPPKPRPRLPLAAYGEPAPGPKREDVARALPAPHPAPAPDRNATDAGLIEAVESLQTQVFELTDRLAQLEQVIRDMQQDHDIPETIPIRRKPAGGLV